MWKRSPPPAPAVTILVTMAVMGAGVLAASTVAGSLAGGCYHIEEFSHRGDPAGNGAPGAWTLRTEENPTQQWADVVPGNGLASLSVRSEAVNNDGGFQSLQWGPVEPFGAIEVRMRGAALPGYAGFLFTYVEPGDGTFDEIDIEVLADDRTDGRTIDHGETTDLRLNTWFGADAEAPPEPDASVFTTIVDEDGIPVSIHDDGLFHTFTIDWHRDHVEFHVDGVRQGRLEPAAGVPDRPTFVIVGFRDLGFGGLNLDEAGDPLWTEAATLEVDYVRMCDAGMIS